MFDRVCLVSLCPRVSCPGVMKADKATSGSVHRKGEMGEFHLRTFTVTVSRRNTSSSWGISIAGGCDQGSPLVITKVRPWSIVEMWLNSIF